MLVPVRVVRVLLALLGSAALVAGAMVAGAVSASAATPGTLRVGCGNFSYPTIGAAVAAATAGQTILVCPGTYSGGVVLSTTVSLVGAGHPVIDATGQDNGVQVLASGSSVQGFTVENATGEGILVGAESPGPAVSNVTISGNTVTNNDRGNPTGAPITTSSYPECNANPASPNVPGDCGEGIHLVNSFGSTVNGNNVGANSGGVLLSDDSGPTYGNLIEYNNVHGNTLDCGITIAGHTPKAFGGVHDNTILGNRITDNGVAGQGAGVVLATPVPGNAPDTGGAVYNNLVSSNYIEGNGIGGVTVHSHAPGQDLHGNTITKNVIGTNNLTPDQQFGPHFVDPVTTGVIVAAVSPVAITIDNNVITDNVDGIWIGDVTPGAVSTSGTATNAFVRVTNPVVTVS